MRRTNGLLLIFPLWKSFVTFINEVNTVIFEAPSQSAVTMSVLHPTVQLEKTDRMI